jgi:hypothetical protein
VRTGAKDVAGNRLDQNRKQPNNLPMEWFFTTGTSQRKAGARGHQGRGTTPRPSLRSPKCLEGIFSRYRLHCLLASA